MRNKTLQNNPECRKTIDDLLLSCKLREACGSLHASDNTYEEVMMKIRGGYEIKTRTALQTAGIALASTLVCAGTAFAVVNGSTFFESAFGDKGQEDVEVHEVEYGYKPGSLTVPAKEWVTVTEETARELVGAEAEEVGISISHGDLTVTIDSVVVDQNGLGVATLTITDPSGFEGLRDAGYGKVVFYEPCSLRGISIYSGTDMVEDRHSSRNSTLILDKNLSTETELHVVMYFQPAFREYADSQLIWRIHGVDESGQWDEFSKPFYPSAQLNTTKLLAKDYSASISPLGIVFDGPIGEYAQKDLAQLGLPMAALMVIKQDGSVLKYEGDYTMEVTETTENGRAGVIVFSYAGDPSETNLLMYDESYVGKNAAGSDDLIYYIHSDGSGYTWAGQYTVEVTEKNEAGQAIIIVCTYIGDDAPIEPLDYNDPAAVELAISENQEQNYRIAAAINKSSDLIASNDRVKLFYDDGTEYVIEKYSNYFPADFPWPETDAKLLGMIQFHSADPEPTRADLEARKNAHKAAQEKIWRINSVIITFNDGTQYVVKDADVMNDNGSMWLDDGGLGYLFNRLIDASDVASVTIPGPDGEDLVFIPA
ncbi:MAG: hypothetical protein IKE43_12240 [Coriobacteriales bacterium]|nr:hypothetical protein [Coriobacteriales bacterium]